MKRFSLTEYLHDARKKPKAVRMQLAFTWAIAFTGLFVVMWGISLQSQFTNALATEEAIEQERSNRGGVFGFFRTTYSNLSAMVDGVGAGNEETAATDVEMEASESVPELDLESIRRQQAAREQMERRRQPGVTPADTDEEGLTPTPAPPQPVPAPGAAAESVIMIGTTSSPTTE